MTPLGRIFLGVICAACVFVMLEWDTSTVKVPDKRVAEWMKVEARNATAIRVQLHDAEEVVRDREQMDSNSEAGEGAYKREKSEEKIKVKDEDQLPTSTQAERVEEPPVIPHKEAQAQQPAKSRPKKKKSNEKQVKHIVPVADERKKEEKAPTIASSPNPDQEKVVVPAPNPDQEKKVVPESPKEHALRKRGRGHNKLANMAYRRSEPGEPETWQWKYLTGDPLDEELEDPDLDRTHLLTAAGMKEQFNKAKDNLIAEIKNKYGEYAEAMFQLEVTGTDAVVSKIGPHNLLKSSNQYTSKMKGQHVPVGEDSIGWNGLVRKLQIKLLQVQLGVIEEKEQRQQPSPRKKYLAKWLWMTAGEKKAAGFGNLYNQSITMVMQNAANEAFESLGIAFRTRNHAMRFIEMAPEVPLCSQQIYGSDFDSIFIDFDEDSAAVWKKPLFIRRAAMAASNQHPIIITDGRTKGDILTVMQNLATMGLPVLLVDGTVHGQMRDAAPSSDYKTKAEISQLPYNLQYFKCGAKGGCGSAMYDRSMCP